MYEIRRPYRKPTQVDEEEDPKGTSGRRVVKELGILTP